MKRLGRLAGTVSKDSSYPSKKAGGTFAVAVHYPLNRLSLWEKSPYTYARFSTGRSVLEAEGDSLQRVGQADQPQIRCSQIPGFSTSAVLGQSKDFRSTGMIYNKGRLHQAQRAMRRRHRRLEFQDPVAYSASEARCRQRLEALLLAEGQSAFSAAA